MRNQTMRQKLDDAARRKENTLHDRLKLPEKVSGLVCMPHPAYRVGYRVPDRDCSLHRVELLPGYYVMEIFVKKEKIGVRI